MSHILTFSFSILISIPLFGASFQGVGDLDGGFYESFVMNISANSRYVVGFSISENSAGDNEGGGLGHGGTESQFVGTEAFRKDLTTGEMIGLGDLPGDPFFHSFASGISSDGSIVVGGSYSGDSVMPGYIPGYEGFWWSVESKMKGIGVIENSIQNSSPAFGISKDGLRVFGQVVWTDGSYAGYFYDLDRSESGIHVIPNIDSVINFGSARAISLDKTIIAGADNRNIEQWPNNCMSPTVYNQNWSENYWTNPVENPCGIINAMSDDARVLAGLSITRSGTSAMIIANSKMKGLRLPQGLEGADSAVHSMACQDKGEICFAAGFARRILKKPTLNEQAQWLNPFQILGIGSYIPHFDSGEQEIKYPKFEVLPILWRINRNLQLARSWEVSKLLKQLHLSAALKDWGLHEAKAVTLNDQTLSIGGNGQHYLDPEGSAPLNWYQEGWVAQIPLAVISQN